VSVIGWLGLLTIWTDGVDLLDIGRFLLLSMFLHGVLRCWIAFAATKRLAEDRRTAAFELLLPTTLSVPEILNGQWLAIARQFKGGITAVLALDVLLCWAAVRESPVNHESMLLYGARGLMLVADAFTLVWYGMWRALTTRSAGEAVAVVLFRVLAAPWLGLIALLSLYQWLGPEAWRDWEYAYGLGLGTWLALGLATDVFLCLVAHRNLRTRFRWAAGEWRHRGGRSRPQRSRS
jgi:hypothetical protein